MFRALNITDADREKWKRGAFLYRNFVEGLPSELRECNGDIRAMFLGEKPAVFKDFSNTDIFIDRLKQFGYHHNGDYIYSPEAVAETVRQHGKEFEGLPIESPEAIIAALNEQWRKKRIPQGLILGYPLSSCSEHALTCQLQEVADDVGRILKEMHNEVGYREFNDALDGNRFVGIVGKGGHPVKIPTAEAKTCLLRYFAEHANHHSHFGNGLSWISEAIDYLQNRQPRDIYGTGWVDAGNSEDSTLKAQRLKAAFEESGILA
jgi:hypothetical protein